MKNFQAEGEFSITLERTSYSSVHEISSFLPLFFMAILAFLDLESAEQHINMKDC
jgi:hypothetical protein